MNSLIKFSTVNYILRGRGYVTEKKTIVFMSFLINLIKNEENLSRSIISCEKLYKMFDFTYF
jgi:hypothetical protein